MEWRKRCANIDPGSDPSGINTAELLAAFITCEPVNEDRFYSEACGNVADSSYEENCCSVLIHFHHEISVEECFLILADSCRRSKQGCLMFGVTKKRKNAVGGLFWQLS